VKLRSPVGRQRLERLLWRGEVGLRGSGRRGRAGVRPVRLPEACSDGDRFAPRTRSQFLIRRAQMALDRVERDVEPLCHLPGGETGRQKIHDLLLTRGQQRDTLARRGFWLDLAEQLAMHEFEGPRVLMVCDGVARFFE